MKLTHVATFIAASILTVGGTAFLSNAATSAPIVDSNSSLSNFFPVNPCAAESLAGNPCAAENPCAGANPCAAENPCAGANPCAAENPCAGANPCAAENPCAGANPCAAENPCAGANPCAAENPCAGANLGQFVAVGSNSTAGTFTVVEEDGKQYIEFSDDFEVSEGPDLEIILHKDQVVESSIEEDDYVSLAPIESFEGNQRYEVPEDVDLDDYASVAVWCEEFNVTFGYAQY